MKSTYEQNLPITTWAEEDRPREKLLAQGRRSLSDAELIAILIGSGSRSESAVDLSKRILNSYQNNLNTLGKLSVQELSKFKGIGEAKAISIIAALELGRRRKEVDTPELKCVFSSSDIFHVLEPYFADLLHEEFWIILLNKRNAIINKILISKGGLAGTVADPKIIFKAALEHNAASIILAHNHPSGNLKPSPADIKLTKKIVEAGRMLDISILDHVIFCDKKYYSFADVGEL
ncbi:DNA repair protein RadC [Pedobacter glucosidilyticus]|uniref:DNA repair protein RadC n=1 Tax=Pedobacter aquae TaxID=2605747 RepID=A0A5C0VCG1_9SPHI|nr:MULTISPECIES: DNA repair protein RadC [Pedobacter]KHJ38686.1 DNA repair protein RadC [Pedobacter glucosidilyticus]QEK50458.1 DNA repair protein RadC [Pedobacter aquae]